MIAKRHLLRCVPLVAAAVVACTSITNTTAVQCTSEAECLSLGPDFAGTTCDPGTKTCVKVAADTDLCTTNKECIDKAGGQPAICRKSDKKCVNLLTPECPSVYAQPGQLLDDDTIVIGMESPKESVELGDVMDKVVQMFQDEFSKKVKGLPGLNGSPNVRPVVVLACVEFYGGITGFGYDEVIRSATHLVKDVQVPLILGPVDPGHTALVAQQVTLPNKVLVIQPTGDNPFINDLPSPTAPTPIIWSTSPSDLQYVPAAAALVKQLEPTIHAAQGATQRPIKIATVSDGTSYGKATSAAVEKILTWNNGKSASDNAMAGNYLHLETGDLLDKVNNPAPEEAISKTLGALFGFAPDIVVEIFAPPGIPSVIFPMMLGWPSAIPFPYHIDLVATEGDFSPLFQILDLVPPLQGKMFSLAAHRDAAAIATANSWVLQFKTFAPEFAQSYTPYGLKVQQWYDASYAAVYAMAANGSKPLTGENLGKTLPLLNPPGQTINVGPDDAPKALGLLTSGQGIDMVGLAGNMNFNPTDATQAYDIDITCPAFLSSAPGKIVTYQPSGFYVQTATNGPGVGTITCPQVIQQ